MNIRESKYKEGDVLKWKQEHGDLEDIVKLLHRWDRNLNQRTAWMVRSADGKGNPYAVPEEELSPLTDEID